MKRTTFLATSASMIALTPTLVGAAENVPGGTLLVERNKNFDERHFKAVLDRPAEIRQLWEILNPNPIVWNNVKNALNGLHFGFGYPENHIAMAFAAHGPASSFNFSDYVWAKYRIGEFFNIRNFEGAFATKNMNLVSQSHYDPSADPDSETGMYQDRSIQMLQRRGLVMLACHTAIEEQSRAFVMKGFAPKGMTGSQVADDILTHLIPGAIVVPSMVATIAVLQKRFGYTYTTLAF
ncbi:MAG TPA: hypothetical protein VMV73_03500 [Candidatus Dormibacteraeota bacterium]|nr:hypothetical protein [Candidatus Dormibacteraeota bacterium]